MDQKSTHPMLIAAAASVLLFSLLGAAGKVTWTQTTNGLVVTVPANKLSDYTCALKITGAGLKTVEAVIDSMDEPIRIPARTSAFDEAFARRQSRIAAGVGA